MSRALDGVFEGGGELGARMRAIDWSQTPLGPVEGWPQSLKTCVRVVLTSRQPMFVWWGDSLINLYNDAYKAIVGGKHPAALGQPASEVWREIWGEIGPRAKATMLGNEGTYDEALLLIMERYGYPEETYYTFSYSPVPNDQGGTGGIFCANTDDTQRIIGERQLTLLRDLAARTAEARTPDQVYALTAECLAADPRDLPFALLYVASADGPGLSLAAATGIERGHPAAPAAVPLEGAAAWPLRAVLERGQALVVEDLASAFESLPSGAWNRPPARAAALPVTTPGAGGSGAVLVVGLSPYRRYDRAYQGFLGLVAGQIAASLATARAYEQERQRDRAKTAFFSNVSQVGAGTTFRVRVPRGRAHLPEGRLGAARTGASTSLGATPFVAEALRRLPAAPGASTPPASAGDPGSTSAPPAPASGDHGAATNGRGRAEASATGRARPLVPPMAGRRWRILLADDDADMRDYVERLLRDYWDVEAVADGAAALAAAQRSPPDLVLSDVMMPGLDGFQLLAALRDDERTAAVPVILLSARAGEEASLEGFAAGATDYLVKPFASRELVARVATHVALGRAQAIERAARAQAEEAGRLKDEFLATLSHELRTPLTAIVGWVAMLRDPRRQHDPWVEKALEVIDRNVKAQAQIVNDVLDVSRIVTGQLSLEPEPFALDVVAREAADIVQHAADAKRLRLTVDTEPSAFVGDPARLRQVCWNLLTNAVRYTPSGGSVSLTLRRAADHLVLTVSDTGMGIEASFLPHVWESFRQADGSSTRKFGGLGLGLSIVRHVVELHGGWVEAESGGLGQGATFRAHLPADVEPPRSLPSSAPPAFASFSESPGAPEEAPDSRAGGGRGGAGRALLAQGPAHQQNDG
ncbi:MAG: ATP-binding protein [Polyangiaceae bacterium]|nr:ATP-binding protein [Polyangiaceae bacterium]